MEREHGTACGESAPKWACVRTPPRPVRGVWLPSRSDCGRAYMPASHAGSQASIIDGAVCEVPLVWLAASMRALA